MPSCNGRPSSYTPEIANVICDLMGDGVSLAKICEQDGLPDYKTVLKWARDIPDFFQSYTAARQIQLDRMADEVITIADASTPELLFNAIGFASTHAVGISASWRLRSMATSYRPITVSQPRSKCQSARLDRSSMLR